LPRAGRRGFQATNQHKGKILPDTNDKEKLVTVVHDGESVEALLNPGFIIKKGDKYFLTLAVWEYEHVPHETPEQKEGVHEIIHLFNEGLREGKLVEAVPIPNAVARFIYTQILPL
jgi:hypothetical protein